MDSVVRRRSLRVLLLAAAGYLAIGIVFAEFSGLATSNAMHLMWRRLAWLVSGAVFAAHIVYEQFRVGNARRAAAIHVSLSAALGACGLAVAANLHEWTTASHFRPSIAFALVAWPLLTAVPSFLVAFAAVAVLSRWRMDAAGPGSAVDDAKD